MTNTRTRKSDDLDIGIMTDNLIAYWNSAGRSVQSLGAKWYPRALLNCKRIARAHGYSTETVVAIVAAMSPQTDWSANIADACDYLTGRPVRAWQSNNRAKMSSCANVMLYGPDSLSGPKVTAFYANLMGDLDAVTVDTWAARAALGVWDIAPYMTVGSHDRIADAYRKAAAAVGTDARTMQAAVWIHIREISA